MNYGSVARTHFIHNFVWYWFSGGFPLLSNNGFKLTESYKFLYLLKYFFIFSMSYKYLVAVLRLLFRCRQ